MSKVVVFSLTFLSCLTVSCLGVAAELLSTFPVVDAELKKQFNDNPIILRASAKVLYLIKKENESFDNANNWVIVEKSKYGAKRCLGFLQNKTDSKKYAGLRKLLFSHPKMKDYLKNHYRMHKTNRDLVKAKIPEYYNISEKSWESHKYCDFPINSKLKQKRIHEKKALQKKISALFEAGEPKMEKAFAQNNPPQLQKIWKDLKKRYEKQKVPATDIYRLQSQAYLKLLDIIRTKAIYQFLPQKEKQCPGMVNKIFAENCKSNSQYSNKLLRATSKMYCFENYINKVPKKCR